MKKITETMLKEVMPRTLSGKINRSSYWMYWSKTGRKLPKTWKRTAVKNGTSICYSSIPRMPNRWNQTFGKDLNQYPNRLRVQLDRKDAELSDAVCRKYLRLCYKHGIFNFNPLPAYKTGILDLNVLDYTTPRLYIILLTYRYMSEFPHLVLSLVKVYTTYPQCDFISLFLWLHGKAVCGGGGHIFCNRKWFAHEYGEKRRNVNRGLAVYSRGFKKVLVDTKTRAIKDLYNERGLYGNIAFCCNQTTENFCTPNTVDAIGCGHSSFHTAITGGKEDV